MWGIDKSIGRDDLQVRPHRAWGAKRNPPVGILGELGTWLALWGRLLHDGPWPASSSDNRSFPGV